MSDEGRVSEQKPRRDDDRPVLPQESSDEREVGWGDERDPQRRDRDWYERERPPHHE